MFREAKIRHSTLENLYIDCPACQRPAILNRATDLGSDERVAGLGVTCPHSDCGDKIWIYGDIINPAHDLLLAEARVLYEERRYSTSVVMLGTALENMLSLYLRVEFLYRPFARTRDDLQIDLLQEAERLLDKRIGRLSYLRLRDTVLRHAVDLPHVPEPENILSMVRRLNTEMGAPTDEQFDEVRPIELGDHLRRLRSATVHELRNKIAHHRAYCPSASEANAAICQAAKIISGGNVYFDISSGDDLEMYSYGPDNHVGRPAATPNSRE